MKISLLLLSLLLAQQPVRQDSATLTGQLRDNEGKPISDVRVALARVETESNSEAPVALSNITQTDSMGRYRLENVLPGRYLLVAGALAALNYYPGVNVPNKGTVVSVAAGEVIPNLDFKISYSGVMTAGLSVGGGRSGIVRRDDRGRLPGGAVSDVQVSINGKRSEIYVPGSRSGSNVADIMSADPLVTGSNVVAVANLPIGLYVKSITAGNVDFTNGPAIVPANVTVAMLEVVLTETAPPGTPTGVKLSGRLTGLELPHGRSIEMVLKEVLIPGRARNGSTLESLTELHASGQDGTFEISGVPPGRYRLQAVAEYPMGAGDSFGYLRTTPVTLDVAATDIKDLEVKYEFKRIEPKPPVPLDSAQVKSLKGVVAGLESAIPKFTVTFTPTRADQPPRSVTVAGKEFSVDLPQGEYRVTVSGLLPAYSVGFLGAGPLDLTSRFLVTDKGIADPFTGTPIMVRPDNLTPPTNAAITIRLKSSATEQ